MFLGAAHSGSLFFLKIILFDYQVVTYLFKNNCIYIFLYGFIYILLHYN